MQHADERRAGNSISRLEAGRGLHMPVCAAGRAGAHARQARQPPAGPQARCAAHGSKARQGQGPGASLPAHCRPPPAALSGPRLQPPGSRHARRRRTHPPLPPLRALPRGVGGGRACDRGGRWQPDFLVGIGRGGLVPAAYLSHRTGIQMLSVDHSSGEVGFGDELLDKLAAKIRAGSRILIVDDINDSGGTIQYLRAAIEAKSDDPAGLRVAVLVHNVRSKAKAEYRGSEIDRDQRQEVVRLPLGSGGAARDAEDRGAGGAGAARLNSGRLRARTDLVGRVAFIVWMRSTTRRASCLRSRSPAPSGTAGHCGAGCRSRNRLRRRAWPEAPSRRRVRLGALNGDGHGDDAATAASNARADMAFLH